MNVYILDENFKKVGIIDTSTSLIFTKRYFEPGDFELYAAADLEVVHLLVSYPYVLKEDDDALYMIESINITTDSENGNYITASGSDIVKILDRRIVWNQTNIKSTVSGVIRELISDNAIDTDSDRIIPRLVLGTALTSEEISVQKTGQSLLEVAKELCMSYGYGYKVRFKNGNLIFDLYSGTEKNVEFSQEYDNLVSSDYNFSASDYKNVALVAGEGEGTARKRESLGSASGMNRFELYVDARDISSNDGEISDQDYRTLLRTRGIEKLAECKVKEEYSGQIIPDSTYIYGTDYNLGDIVTVKNEYGIKAKTRIIEIIECEDETGHSFIPSFGNMEVLKK